jgi:hypothetical protein
MEARLRDLHSETRKGPGTAFVLSTHKFLEKAGKVSTKMLLAMVLIEASRRGLLRDEQFCFKPRHSTSLQLARLFERVSKNIGE